jgi:DNA-binding NarL/FixJ family response regulator
MTRVLVADDHRFFRTCLVDLLNASADVEVVGECDDGDQVVPAVSLLRPDVVLLDVRMGVMSGIDAAAALQREGAAARVLILTNDSTGSSLVSAQTHGAVGYLVKGGRPHLTLDAIRRVADGGTAWPEDHRPSSLR